MASWFVPENARSRPVQLRGSARCASPNEITSFGRSALVARDRDDDLGQMRGVLARRAAFSAANQARSASRGEGSLLSARAGDLSQPAAIWTCPQSGSIPNVSGTGRMRDDQGAALTAAYHRERTTLCSRRPSAPRTRFSPSSDLSRFASPCRRRRYMRRRASSEAGAATDENLLSDDRDV